MEKKRPDILCGISTVGGIISIFLTIRSLVLYFTEGGDFPYSMVIMGIIILFCLIGIWYLKLTNKKK